MKTPLFPGTTPANCRLRRALALLFVSLISACSSTASYQNLVIDAAKSRGPDALLHTYLPLSGTLRLIATPIENANTAARPELAIRGGMYADILTVTLRDPQCTGRYVTNLEYGETRQLERALQIPTQPEWGKELLLIISWEAGNYSVTLNGVSQTFSTTMLPTSLHITLKSGALSIRELSISNS